MELDASAMGPSPRATSGLLQASLEALSEALVGGDRSGRVRWCNRAFEQLVGLPRDVVLGASLEAVLRVDGATTEGGHPVRRWLAVEEGPRWEDLVVGGRDLVAEVVPVRPEGEEHGFVAVLRDVTEAKSAARAQALAQSECERSNAELERFAFVAAHDLREPLRAVTGFVELVARRYRGRLDPEADEFFALALEGATRMRELLDDLLALARLRGARRPLVPTPLEAVLDAARAQLRVALEETGAELTHGPLPTVAGDASELTRLLQNLLENAIRFRGDAPPRIHLAAARRGAWWRITVEDRGVGLEPPVAARVFELFHRASPRPEDRGTGLGLAICQRIVERHGGRIDVRSTPGQGSCFEFTLPAVREGAP